jgi:hypothetical protein
MSHFLEWKGQKKLCGQKVEYHQVDTWLLQGKRLLQRITKSLISSITLWSETVFIDMFYTLRANVDNLSSRKWALWIKKSENAVQGWCCCTPLAFFSI